MLKGRLVTLRPPRRQDLDAMYAAHVDIANRGAFFPLGVRSEPAFMKAFEETGFWERDEGTLLITTPEGEVAGHIEFFSGLLPGRVRAPLPALRRVLQSPGLHHRGGAAAWSTTSSTPRSGTGSTS